MILIFLMRSLFILFLSFSSLICASQFDNPYQGNILVEMQSEDQLKALALKQVLVKVSGNGQLAELNEAKLLEKKMRTLLSQYGYQTLQGRRYFMAVFDKRKINQALQEMQQPVWGDTRPVTLLWLITNSDSERILVSDDRVNQSTDTVLSSVLQQQQHNRGIRLQFPLMDLEDNLALSISDISGHFYDPIATASKRYGANHFVVGQLQENNEQQWSLAWQLVKHDRFSKFNRALIAKQVKGEKSALIAMMVSDIADYYAGQYAISKNQGEKISQTIYVKGIHSLAQLTRLNKVLTNLFSVASFTVIRAEAEMVTLDIEINGALTSFKNGLFAQPNLQPDLSQSEDFYFKWYN